MLIHKSLPVIKVVPIVTSLNSKIRTSENRVSPQTSTVWVLLFYKWRKSFIVIDNVSLVQKDEILEYNFLTNEHFVNSSLLKININSTRVTY